METLNITVCKITFIYLLLSEKLRSVYLIRLYLWLYKDFNEFCFINRKTGANTGTPLSYFPPEYCWHVGKTQVSVSFCSFQLHLFPSLKLLPWLSPHPLLWVMQTLAQSYPASRFSLFQPTLHFTVTGTIQKYTSDHTLPATPHFLQDENLANKPLGKLISASPFTVLFCHYVYSCHTECLVVLE